MNANFFVQQVPFLYLMPQYVCVPTTCKYAFFSFTGIIGYPIGLAIGAGCCALYHYLVRRRCARTGSYRPRQRRPSSSSSTRTLTRTDTPVTPTNIQPNIYRSGFSDETIFKTGEKMNENSYISGKRDW